jgi:hypothetical protein
MYTAAARGSMKMQFLLFSTRIFGSMEVGVTVNCWQHKSGYLQIRWQRIIGLTAPGNNVSGLKCTTKLSKSEKCIYFTPNFMFFRLNYCDLCMDETDAK